jgi:cyanophycinase
MLVIAIGGNTSSRTALKLRDYLTEYFSREPSMLIIPTATSDPANFSEIQSFWAKIFKDVCILPLHKKVNSFLSEEELHNKLQNYDFVFFSGGDQKRIIQLIRGHSIHRFLLEKNSSSLFAVGGTSAGAAALGDLCILSGSPARFESIKITSGLGLLKGYVVDQHFKERKRFGRLIYVVLKWKINGVGIDEDTAAIFRSDGELLKILGSGFAWFFEYDKDGRLGLCYKKEAEGEV